MALRSDEEHLPASINMVQQKKKQVDALQAYSVKDSMLLRFFQQLKIFTAVSQYIGEVFLHTVTIQQTS